MQHCKGVFGISFDQSHLPIGVRQHQKRLEDVVVLQELIKNDDLVAVES
jgi:hypothetical protein